MKEQNLKLLSAHLLIYSQIVPSGVLIVILMFIAKIKKTVMFILEHIFWRTFSSD